MAFERDLEDAIPSLRRYARALLGDPDRADDLVQDCLERAVSRRHLWRADGSLRAWLFRMMHNLHVNLRRRENLRRTLPLDELERPPSAGERQTDRVALAEMARAVRRLPEDQQRVLLLVALEGFTYREVADILDIPVGTVMSRLSRARERLRLLVGEGSAGARIRRVK